MAVQKTDRLLYRRDKNYKATVEELSDRIIADSISSDTPNDLELGTDSKLKLVKRTPIEEVLVNKASLGTLNPNPVFGLGSADYENLVASNKVNLVHDVVDGTEGSIHTKSHTNLTYISDNFYPFDTGLQYQAELSVKHKISGSGVDSAKEYGIRTFLGTSPHDSDRLFIAPYHVNTHGNSQTFLAQDLNNGDTTITVDDASNWYTGTVPHIGSLLVHPKQPDGTYKYQGYNGRLYDNLKYSRISALFGTDLSVPYVDNGNGTWTVTLKNPWSLGAFTTGDAIRQSPSGGNYIYWISPINEVGTTDFHNVKSTWNEGTHWTRHRNGIAFVKALALLGYSLYSRGIGATNWVYEGGATPTIEREGWFSKLKLNWRHIPPVTNLPSPVLHTAALSTGWGHFGGAYGVVQYRKDAEGFVHINGLIKETTASSSPTMLVLPSGYRPLKREVFVVIAGSSGNRVDILPHGVMLRMDGTRSLNEWTSLNNIKFYAGN